MNEEAFLTKCYLVKYLIKISFNTSSDEAESEILELKRFVVGLIYTTAEQNKKKSWIEFNFTTENCDLAFTI